MVPVHTVGLQSGEFCCQNRALFILPPPSPSPHRPNPTSSNPPKARSSQGHPLPYPPPSPPHLLPRLPTSSHRTPAAPVIRVRLVSPHLSRFRTLSLCSREDRVCTFNNRWAPFSILLHVSILSIVSSEAAKCCQIVPHELIP